MKYFLCAFLLYYCLALQGCSGSKCKSQAAENEVFIKTAPTSNVESFFESFHSIVLETNNENLISRIDILRFDDNNNIWISDRRQNKIFLFDSFGNYIRKINRLGQGPDEYLGVSDFQIIEDKVFILSRANRRIFIYDLFGTPIRSHSLDDFYDYFHIVGDTVFLFSNFSNNKLYNIITYNLETEEYGEKFLPFPRNQSFSFPPTPFNVIATEHPVLLTQQYDHTIYSLNTDLKTLEAFLAINFDTKERLSQDIHNASFYDAYQNLAHSSVVRRIEMVDKRQNTLFILYTLDYTHRLTRINIESGENESLELGFNDKLPYIFAKPLFLGNGYLIGYLDPVYILMFDENFKSNKNESGILSEDDNPVLFFNRLKY